MLSRRPTKKKPPNKPRTDLQNQGSKDSPDRLKRLSMDGIDPREALRLAMQVNPPDDDDLPPSLRKGNNKQ